MSWNNVISSDTLLDILAIEERYKAKCKKRVIFLDIDGVLNNIGSQYAQILLLPDLVKRVNRLAWYADSSIVISSTWRKAPEAWKYIRYAFSVFGFDAKFNENQLPWDEDGEKNRSAYISEYIEEYGVTNFVILDDNDYYWHKFALDKFVVQTNPNLGFTEDDLDRAVSIIGILRKNI